MKKFNVYVDEVDYCYSVYANDLYNAMRKFAFEYPGLVTKVTDICVDWLFEDEKENTKNE